MTDLAALYKSRFGESDLSRRSLIWRALCRFYFNKIVQPDDVIVDLGCGYGEFINNIVAAKRSGLDLNADAARFLVEEVDFICARADAIPLPADTIDVVFSSNFLEHLHGKDELIRVLMESLRILRPGGKLILLGPNVKYLASSYWDFYDHHLPLSHLSMTEALAVGGFEVTRVTPRFLPYTTLSAFPVAGFLIAAYLAMPIFWPLLGKQFLIEARKPGEATRVSLSEPDTSHVAARKVGVVEKLPRPDATAGRGQISIWLGTLRVHQWAKNLLIFVPLLLSVNAGSTPNILAEFGGFACLGLAASSTYILNDLMDLASDRRHRTKRNRPLASGALSTRRAAVAAILLVSLAFAWAMRLAAGFQMALLAYVFTTVAYSLRLKRVPLLDVMVLGGLYSLRIVMGTILAGVAFSPWLLTFSAFFFFSMSMAKRHVEVTAARDLPPEIDLPGRGYRPADAPLALTLGVGAGVASVLVVVQYMMAEAFPSHVYSLPTALWTTPVLLGAWICRIWFMAHRGALHDDPVEFALKDPVSLGLGAALGLAFLAARF